MVRSVQFLSVGLFLSAGIRPTTGVQLVVRRHRVFWDAAVAAEFEPSPTARRVRFMASSANTGWESSSAVKSGWLRSRARTISAISSRLKTWTGESRRVRSDGNFLACLY